MKTEILQILGEERLIESLGECYLHPNIPEKKLLNAMSSHGVKYGETILFLYDSTLFGSASEGFIVTEYGISCVSNDDKPAEKLLWKNIERVVFDLHEFYFFSDEGTSNYLKWHRNEVASPSKSETIHCVVLATRFTEIAKLYENEETLKFEEIKYFIEEDDYVSFEKTAEEYLEQFGDDGSYSCAIRFLKAAGHFDNDLIEEAKEEIQFCLHEIEEVENHPYNYKVFGLYGDILFQEKENYKALTFYRKALDLCTEKKEIFYLNRRIEEANKGLQEHFLEKDYGERKLILIDNAQADLSSTDFKVLVKNKLPAIKFEMGHPVNRELYVGHPYNKQVYIPVSSLEETLFMDKFQEFSYFLQSLGAIKISIENKRGKEFNKMAEISSETEVDIDAKVASSNTKRSSNSKSDSSSDHFRHTSRIQTFSPVRKPFLPENLVWFPHETSWQRLYEQRVNGHILNHSETISTEQNQVITKNEKKNIEQSLKYYLIKAEGSHSSDAATTFKEKETTEWVIHVEFAPIESLQSEKDNFRAKQKISLDKVISEKVATDELSKEQLTADEIKYQTRVKLLTEDSGLLTEEDKGILDRISRKLKINVDKARELEAQVLESISTQYLDEELKYIEEIKFCLEDDGAISEKERLLLEHEREELGISEERASEMEAVILKTRQNAYK